MSLIISGVIDGPLPNGVPKAIELTATSDIADLSIYALESANNGNPSGGPEYTFPAVSLSAGDRFYVSFESSGFNTFFGFAPDDTAGALSINGNDAIILYKNGVAFDVFGEVGVDGDGEAWDHQDGWAYRNDGASPTTSFDPTDWTFSGPDALDGETSNGTAANPFPIDSFGPALRMISEIQGSGEGSPLDGTLVTVEAIVVGDFQEGDADDGRNLGGFYLQEEDADADSDSLTSEGIFVFDGDAPITDVAVGDKVQVTGVVDEFSGETQISNVTNVTVVSSGNSLPGVTQITLPTASSNTSPSGGFEADLEAYEGMLVSFPQELVITELAQLDRFNEIELVAGDRPQQFTQFNEPDAAGYQAYLQDLGRKTIFYDDGLNVQNGDINNLDGFGPGFSTANAPSMGDTIQNLSGVLSYQQGSSGSTWRVRSTQDGENSLDDSNPRDPLPEDVGGSLKVASLNLDSFFTTLDESGNLTDTGAAPRGADSQDEFDRQIEKLVTLIQGLDADILGLIELENSSSDAAVLALVDALNNDPASTRTYAAVETGLTGGDAFTNGFIYDVNTVALKGDFQLLDSSVDSRFFDDKNRPALAQTFEEIDGGGVFTAVVNHLKSKGSPCGVGDDADDGQGNCNVTRTLAAEALVDWLETDPTGSGDEDFLILGDLAAYAREDPIDAILEGADDLLGTADDFVNLALDFIGPEALSFVFDGLSGTFDYALSNLNLLSQVTGATIWNVNADEADALDYDLDFGRDPSIFDGSSPARASDHDPILVGLDLEPTFNLVEQTGRVRVWGTDDRDLIELAGTRLAVVNAGDGADRYDITALREDSSRNRLVIRGYEEGEKIVGLFEDEVLRVRESSHSVKLVLEGDRDLVVLRGIDDIEYVTFDYAMTV